MRRPTSGPRYCGGKRTELKVTEAQASAWNAYADALRTNAQKLGEVRVSMMAQHAANSRCPHWLIASNRKTIAASSR
jgi:IS1 family transposase